jgi:hypothetical protein
LASGCSTVVEHLPHYPKVEGFSPASTASIADTRREIIVREIYIYIYIYTHIYTYIHNTHTHTHIYKILPVQNNLAYYIVH